MGMPSIIDAIASLREAGRIAKTIVNSEAELEVAELKKRLAELLEALADSQLTLVEVQSFQRDAEEENERLTKALSIRESVIKRGDAYFASTEGDETHGDPFCTACWERDHRLLHLTSDPDHPRVLLCPQCKHRVSTRHIRWPSDVDLNDQ